MNSPVNTDWMPEKIKPLDGDEERIKIIIPIEPIQKKVATWKSEDAELIAWFLEEQELPYQPFQLKQGMLINDCDKFYDSLKRDIEEGPKGVRALFGGLKNDLKALKKLKDN